MATIRGTLKDDLRDNLGEPDQSTWTADTDGGTWLQSEIHRYLNRAQFRVCEDCLEPGNETDIAAGLVEELTEIHLVKNTYKYVLPDDTVDVLSVTHLPTTGRYRELVEAPIQNLYDGFRPDSETSSYLKRYEVAENTAKVITEGIATGTSATSLADTDRATDSVYRFDTGTAMLDDSAAAIAADDIVVNVTDGSSSPIATSGIAAGTLTLDGLTGGRRNTFERGDRFKVIQQEYSRKTLYVWPVPNAGDETVIESFTTGNDAEVGIGNVAGTNQYAAQQFIVDRDCNVSGVSIYLGAKTGTPLGSLEIRIETDNSGPTGTLVHVNAKTAIESPTVSVKNYVDFPNVFPISANTLYNIVARIPAQSNYYASPSNNYFTWQVDTGNGYSGGTEYLNTGSWAAVAANDLLFEIYAIEESERLLVRRSRYPKSMDADTTMMEIPDYGRRALLWYAEHLAWQKAGNLTKADYAERKYETEIAKVRLRMLQNRQRPFTTIKDVMGWGRRGSIETYARYRGSTRLIERVE